MGLPVGTEPAAVGVLNTDQPVHRPPQAGVVAVAQAEQSRDQIAGEAGEGHLMDQIRNEVRLPRRIFPPLSGLLPLVLILPFGPFLSTFREAALRLLETEHVLHRPLYPLILPAQAQVAQHHQRPIAGLVLGLIGAGWIAPIASSLLTGEDTLHYLRFRDGRLRFFHFGIILRPPQ